MANPFLRLLRPHKLLSLAALAALVSGAALNLLFPTIVGNAFDAATVLSIKQNPWRTAEALIVLFAAQSLAFFFRSYLFGILSQRSVNELRKKVFDGFLFRPIEFFDRTRSSDLVSRLGSDTLLIQEALAFRLSVAVRYSIQVILGFILMVSLSPRLTGVTFLILPPLMVFSRYLGKKLKSLSRAQQDALSTSGTIAEESLSAIRLLKSMYAEPCASDRYTSALGKLYQIGASRSRVSAVLQSSVTFLMNTALVFLFVYALSLVEANQLSVPVLIKFVMYGALVAVSAVFIISSYSDLVQASGAAERTFEFLDEHATEDINSGGDAVPAAISFKHVSFNYPTRPEVPVLQDISLTIPKGKITAIVGPSGAGKSALISLLLKFYKPLSGSIEFDTTSLESISSKLLREKIAYVPQETILFGLTIEENLRMAKTDSD